MNQYIYRVNQLLSSAYELFSLLYAANAWIIKQYIGLYPVTQLCMLSDCH